MSVQKVYMDSRPLSWWPGAIARWNGKWGRIENINGAFSLNGTTIQGPIGGADLIYFPGENGEEIPASILSNLYPINWNMNEYYGMFWSSTTEDWVILDSMIISLKIPSCIEGRYIARWQNKKIVKAKGDTYMSQLGFMSFIPKDWACTVFGSNLEDIKTMVPPVKLSCPREGCKLNRGTGSLASNTFDVNSTCPECGFPGLLSKAGWCEHKKLRMGYDSQLHCLAEGCNALFKLRKDQKIALKPNMKFVRLQEYLRTIPTVEKDDFLVLVGIDEKVEVNKGIPIVFTASNTEAKAPNGGWKWPEDDLPF